MEKQRPLAVAGVSRHLTGKTLLKYHSYSFSAGEWVTVGCSTRNWSWRFFTRELIDDHRSCKDVCDEAGAGPLGIGLRPYRAELSARSTGGEASYLSHINVGVHMNRDMFAVKHGLWKDRWFDSSGGVVKRSSASPAGVRLRCVCGPGQSLDGKMVFRRFDHAWD
jgi:hypothetical protein